MPDRDVFLYDGNLTLQEPDSRTQRFNLLVQRYKHHLNAGNIDFLGVCDKRSSDKYWENFNYSFAEFMQRKFDVLPDSIYYAFQLEDRYKNAAWYENNRHNYRMIEPNVLNAYKSFAKYDRPQYKVDQNVMAMARDWCKRHFMPHMLGSRVMSWKEVIDDIDMSTSSGYPIGLKWPQKKSVPPEIMLDVAEMYWEELLRDEIQFAPIWTCSQKRELRSKEKIEAGKVRTFTASSFEQTLAMNRLCLDMNNRFYNSNMETWSFVGCSKFMGGWDRLYRKLNIHPLAYELDETNYDCSLLQILMYGQAEIRWSMLRTEDKTPENKKRLWNLYDQAVHSLVLMEDGALLRKHTGNPSGSANTIVDNTMILFTLFAYAYIKSCPDQMGSGMCTYNQFMKNVSAALNGDDNTFTTSEQLRNWFNPTTIKAVWDEIGVVTKTPSFSPRKLEECEFLSQSFVYDRGVWCPSPETDRVLCSLLWASKKDDVRWHFLRACALRLDSWANPECKKVLDQYIEYLINSIWKNELHGEIDGIPISEIFALWRSEEWCRALYSGNESLIGLLDKGVKIGNASLPFKKFFNLLESLLN